jgi:hypothetical protein
MAREVADVVVHALTGDSPAFRIQTSDHGRRYVARKLADPDGSQIQAMTRSWVSPVARREGSDAGATRLRQSVSP